MSPGGDGTYAVVEVSPVAEDTLERALNERAAQGWSFDSVHFVTREGSHRPALAYLFFTRAAPPRPGRRRRAR
ncbi:MAG TPA: DUF4177 domain-containing protein [Anaeromyxobacteraceae bacterium]|nr:DUF4177 domain-containing protein [Anaeromyxobacteraceae bacterium]